MGQLLMINPRKRRRKASSKRRVRRARRSSSTTISTRVKRRRYRRNPIGGGARGIVGQLTSSLQDGAIGGAGAIATEMITNLLPLPDALKTGLVRPVTTAVLGVGLGMALGAVSGKMRGVGKQMAQGAVTVAMYNAIRPMVAGKLPGLSAYDNLLGAYDELGAYDNLLGAYQNPSPVSYYGSQEGAEMGYYDDLNP